MKGAPADVRGVLGPMSEGVLGNHGDLRFFLTGTRAHEGCLKRDQRRLIYMCKSSL